MKGLKNLLIGISHTIKNELTLNYNKLPNLENCTVGVIGLGYVGLPLALNIAQQNICLITKKILLRNVIAYDINSIRINELKQNFDRNKLFSEKEIKNTNKISFTDEKNLLINCDVFIVTVPTPLDGDKNPNLNCLKEASKVVGSSIGKSKENNINKIVIFESTVYPGVTEEICVPIIEKESGLIFNSDNRKSSFYCGYSPERINPGDKEHTLKTILKITSGCNEKVTSWIDKFYSSFIEAGTFKTSSMKIAEAAKIIENIQRDVNIALVNELSLFFKKIDIDTNEVLEAASTKWNFHNYHPGLVGGHCIGVDPYYLTFIAEQIGFKTKLISAGRAINDSMHKYLFEQIMVQINKQKEKNILILGISYKSNCPDIRNSQLICLIKNLKKINGLQITLVDPIVDKQEVFAEVGLKALDIVPKNKKYSIILFGLYHEEFKKISKDKFKFHSSKNTMIFDLTNKIKGGNIIHF